MFSKYDAKVKSKYFAARHKAYIRFLSGLAPYYIVNEYPKSGGTWLAQMLADTLDLPFRRNEPIRWERAVTHGHFLRPEGLKNVIVMWRDPRDILVSFYYHCYFVNEHDNSMLVSLMKKKLPFSDYNDIKENLPYFIRFISNHPVSPSFSWPDFAARWIYEKNVYHTSYEALRENTENELDKVVFELTGHHVSCEKIEKAVENHSFARAKERAKESTNKEIEVSFIREGAMGGWRRHFSEEALNEIQSYKRFMGLMGYKL